MNMLDEENNSLKKNEDENIIEAIQNPADKNSDEFEEKKIEINFYQEINPYKVRKKI